jgi:subtilisin family serine protease
MAKSKDKLKQYVVLPARGLTASGLESAALTAIMKPGVTQAGGNQLVADEGLGLTAAPMVVVAETAVAASRHLLSSARHVTSAPSPKMKIDHSFMGDGPKLVTAAATAERLLRANGYRLVPVTKYDLALPKAGASKKKKAKAPRRKATSVKRSGRRALSPLKVHAATAVSVQGANDFLRHLYFGLRQDGGKLGEGVTVAVLDSGVDGTHPRLAHAVNGGRGMVPGESDLDWGPCTWPNGVHGTHVAGIICAEGDSATGPLGVAPRAKVRSYRIFSKTDGSVGASNYSIINAVRAAVEDGCDIINMSISGTLAREDGVRDAVNYAYDNGSLCIAAAGNDFRRPVGYPAAHSNCIAISALGKSDLIPAGDSARDFISSPKSKSDSSVFLAKFSNFGPQIDFAGPGVWIVSTLPQNGTGPMSGTSMAAPAISGFAAVVLSRNGNILGASRNAARSEAIYQSLVARAKLYDLGSFDYEGYGIPQM